MIHRPHPVRGDSIDGDHDRGGFEMVTRAFLRAPGLPFDDRLDARTIQEAFASREALFAQDRVFSTEVVLWAFLGQALSDGKQASCSAAVAQIAAQAHQAGLPAPCGDTGDYCRARSKLNLQALRDLVQLSARRLDAGGSGGSGGWRYADRPAKLVDGFTFTMPDTPANQRDFPQSSTQAPGVGLPIARAVAVISLDTAAIHDLAVGPYKGKQTGEPALLRTMFDSFDPGDLAIFDRFHCSYMNLALLRERGVDVCTRLHHRRDIDWSATTPLQDGSWLAAWTRPACPPWMSLDTYERMPPTLTVRIVKVDVTDPSSRVEQMTIVTTLTDPQAWSPAAIAQLYGYRWEVELDIRAIKSTLSLDHVRCKSPAMVRRELWVTLLGYNLVRGVAAEAARRADKPARRMSFTLTCQEILTLWLLLTINAAANPAALVDAALQRIAARPIPNRPGRIEPRVVKRRPKPHKLMTEPRHTLRDKLRTQYAKGTY